MKLADLWVKLGLKDDSFQKGISGAEKKTSKLGGVLKKIGPMIGAAFAIDAVVKAGKAVFDYAKEISAARDQVKKLTDLTGVAASRMAGQATSLAKVYNQDINESIKASNIMMRTFGKTSKETFKLLNTGLSSSANANGDLLEQISEYAPHFKEAGMSAEQMLNVIKEGAEVGVFSDKAADTIKEGSIRIREMTDATKEALNGIGLSSDQIQKDIASGAKSMFDVMQEVSGQLDKLPEQSPEVGAALADIFGGPGEDAVNFIRTLKDVEGGLDNLTDKTNETQLAQQKYAEELEKFHTIGAQVFGGTGEMMTRLKTEGMKMVNSLITGVVDLVNYFIDLYNESVAFRVYLQGLGAYFKSLKDIGANALEYLIDTFKNLGMLLKAVFTGDIKGIKEAWQNSFKNSAKFYKNTGKDVAENFKNGLENALHPKKKIEFISLTPDEAETAGKKDAENYSKGFNQNANVTPRFDYGKMKSKEVEGVTMSDGSGVEMPSMDLADMTGDIARKNEQLKQLLAEQLQVWNDFKDRMAETMEAFAEDVVSGFAETMGEMIAAGNIDPGELGKQLLGQIGNLLSSLGKMLITFGIGSEAFQSLLATGMTNPVSAGLAIAAGAALVALGGAISSKAQSSASGGGSTSAASGGGGSTSRTSSVGDAAENMTFNIDLSGVLRGNDIKLSADRTNYKKNAIG